SSTTRRAASGMSSAVKTASTPGKSWAADTSIRSILACPNSDRRSAKYTSPGSRISPANRPRPVIRRTSSRRRICRPIQRSSPNASRLFDGAAEGGRPSAQVRRRDPLLNPGTQPAVFLTGRLCGMRRPITTQAARAVPLVGYTALAFALFANVWAAPASRWIGVDGDPDGTIWSIAWGAYSLVHHLNPFITDHIFFPSGTNVLWSNADAPMALSWLVAPVTLTLGPIVAYNLLQTLALALSAWTAYLAIRRFVTRPWAAALGGLVYGFGPYMLAAAYGHMALSFGVVPPLLVIVLDRLFVRRDLSPILAGLAAGVLEAFQLHVTQELVASEAIIVAVC